MPNWAHIHVMINHLPIIGFPLVAVVLAMGLARRSRDLLLVATALTVLIGAGTFAVKQSGEQAEEVVEQAVWADDDLIHEHEEAAEKATIAALVTALIAAAVWFRLRGQAAPALGGPTLVLALLLVTSGLMAWTALEGGPIRHDEFGGGRPVPGREVELPTDR